MTRCYVVLNWVKHKEWLVYCMMPSKWWELQCHTPYTNKVATSLSVDLLHYFCCIVLLTVFRWPKAACWPGVIYMQSTLYYKNHKNHRSCCQRPHPNKAQSHFHPNNSSTTLPYHTTFCFQGTNVQYKSWPHSNFL